MLDHTLKLIDGTEKNLADFKGNVVVIVNVASRCGFTPQYTGLQRLFNERKDEGLVILAFPANNFGGQEPGTNREIAEFCRTNYQVTFPLFERISVVGDDAHPLFKELAASRGAPRWNFTKYLVNRAGEVTARFDSRVQPDDPEFVRAIDDLLAKQP